MNRTYAYSAQDNLETMADAVNYNRYQRDFILAEIHRLGAKKVLDFGAGIGTYTDLVSAKGHSVECVELDPDQSKILKNKGYKVYSDIRNSKTKYDVIFSLNVLEHIKDDAAALTSLKNALADTGAIVVFVPAFQLVFSNLDVKAEHYRRYRIKDMRRLADKTNLKIRSIKYCDPVGFFGALFYRLTGASGKLTRGSVLFFDKILFPISVFVEPLFRKILGKNILVIFEKRDGNNV